MPTDTDARRGPLPPALPAILKDMGQPQLRGVLGQRNAAILCRYYGIGHPNRETLEAIGKAQDPPISRERVRQIVQRGLYLLKVSP